MSSCRSNSVSALKYSYVYFGSHRPIRERHLPSPNHPPFNTFPERTHSQCHRLNAAPSSPECVFPEGIFNEGHPMGRLLHVILPDTAHIPLHWMCYHCTTKSSRSCNCTIITARPSDPQHHFTQRYSVHSPPISRPRPPLITKAFYPFRGVFQVVG
jgi:hypothetical protein